MTEPDSGKANAAIKDGLDRSSGKAVERKKIEHSMQDISDEQLDALLMSGEEDLEEDDGTLQ